MTLSLRARITLFFTMFLGVVLSLAFVSIYLGHQRSRLAEIDQDLTRTDAMIAKLISSDLEEQPSLVAAATEALQEFDLHEVSVTVFDAQGALLAGDAGIADGPVDRTSPATEHTDRGGTRILRLSHDRAGSPYRIVARRSLDPLEEELSTLRQWLIASFVVFSSLAALLGSWFSGRALQPVTTMAQQARSMTGEARGARLASSARSDELGDLGRAFNGLIDRIESTLVQQRRFMADASHELRTPVSVARTAIEVTQAKPGRSESEYQECLSIVRAQMMRLSGIVDDLFTLARADSAALPLDRQRFYLDELVMSCVKDAALLAHAKGASVEFLGAEDLEILGDERLLRQMISNLLDNAVRHGSCKTQVRVGLTRLGSTVELAVADSNSTIDVAERERIFERFVRLDPARSGEGAGLGLPIARAIAVAHGGSLRLVPGSPGNTFLAVIPAE